MSWKRQAAVSAVVSLWVATIPLGAAEEELALGVRTTEPRTPAQQQAAFRLPPGFTIQLVAEEPSIHKPMNMAFDALGRLWVTTSIEYPFAAPTNRPARDRVMIFEDFGPDGRARKATEFADGLNIPIGVHPFRSAGKDGRETWKALVWSIPNIWLLEDTDGDGKADRREIYYGPFDHTRDTHGNQASFRRGFDGWLYATHGFNNDSHVTSRDGNRVDMNSGNTYRVRLDGSRIEHHTWGQVNPFGLSWDARGNLYSSDCHSAPLYQLLAGGYYPSFGKPHDGLGFAPTLMEHAHGSTAIDGACYYTDDLWSAEFQENLFIGNVMTSRLNRDRIEFIGSSPRAIELKDFLTCDDPWFRPVDVCLAPDGALYIADFYNRIIGHYEVPLQHPGRDRERGRLWRVVYSGEDGKARLRPGALATGIDGLVGELASPSLARRLLAMEELEDRFAAAAALAVRKAAQSPVNSHQRVHALWMQQRLGIQDAGALRAAAASPDALVRTHVQRMVTDLHYRAGRKEAVPPALVSAARELALQGLQDADALVRRCAAEAIGMGSEPNVEPLLKALAAAQSADTHLVYVLRKAIRDQLRLKAGINAVLARRDWSDADVRALANVAIAVASTEASAFLMRELPRFSQSGGPSSADVLRHAARHAPESELAGLVALARQQHAGDSAVQFGLFQSVEQGLQQRGVALPPVVRDWGATLATDLLGAGDPTAGWSNLPLAGAPTANPWDLQERKFTDGTVGMVLSSFPRGEALTGTLRSTAFPAPARFSFWMCGHDGYPDKPVQGLNGARLRDAVSGAVLASAPPPRDDTARRIEWDLSAHTGKPVVFEVTDGDTAGAYAWIAVARFEPGLVKLPTVGLRAATERRAAAADLSARLGLKEQEAVLRRAALDRVQDPDVRLASARASMALSDGASVPLIAGRLVDPQEPVAFAEKLGDVLAGQRNVAARDAVLLAMKSVPQRLQQRWAGVLVSTPEGAQALLEAAESGRAPARLLLGSGIRTRLVAARIPGVEDRIRKVVADLPPADEAREKLVLVRRQLWDSKGAGAVVAEGERVYQQQCSACHQLNGKGGLVGPQLTGIGNRGAERLCEDVLDPNRNVDHAFRQTLITLKSGDTVSGLFRRDDGAQVILANALGAEVPVIRAEIAERRESDLSLMPDNFGEAIPEPDFLNLLAYLLAQRGR
jgi:putative heme-binding domain-containing protein